MAETPSVMIELGTIAPNFNLQDVCREKFISLSDVTSPKGTVIMFICNHCPYVQHILSKVIEVATNYQKEGLRFVAINSNDIETYPEDGPEAMRTLAENKHFPFPYLFDPTQEVARAYKAACTPDFFVFDGNLKCVYRGRFDKATPGNQQLVTGNELTSALDALLKGDPISNVQYPSLGCNIKWKKK